MTPHDAFPGVFAGLAVSFLAASLLAGPASAQTDAEVNAGIQFDFSTPGARSLAMGGAFVGLADDATAAFTNPAGLLELTQPEISFEGRRFDFTHTFTDRGHAFGFVTGIGVDTIEGVRTGQAEDVVTGLSFLSYFYPRPEWALAVYRHELMNFETNFKAEGAFFDFFDSDGTRQTLRLQPVIAALDLEIVNFGLSAAFRLTDAFRLGFGVSFYDFQIASLQQRFSTVGIDLDTGPRPPDAPGSLFGPVDFSPGNENDFQEEVGTDEDSGFNVGFLWHMSRQWSLGVVYRLGPKFDFETASRVGAFLEALSGDPRGTPIHEDTARFNVPDVFAIGVAFKPDDSVRVTFDYDHIEYSALTEGLIGILEPLESRDASERAALEGLSVDNSDIFRLGFEYRLMGRHCPVSKQSKNCTYAIRLGSWHDPDHKMRFDDEPGLDPNTRAQAIQFLGGEDEFHISAGLGLIFKRRFQLDAAFDISDMIDTFALSAIVRFGGETL